VETIFLMHTIGGSGGCGGDNIAAASQSLLLNELRMEVLPTVYSNNGWGDGPWM
jgi:hypothetical protein